MERCFVGPRGRRGIQEFWEKQKDMEWVIRHPHAQRPEEWNRLVPFRIHGDGARVFNIC